MRGQGISPQPCHLAANTVLTAPLKSPSSRVIVDMDVFRQILELDEEDDHGFSQEMVRDYLDQARSTIKVMDDNLCAGLSL